MRLLTRVRSWTRSLLKREGSELEMDAELRSHVEMYAEDLVSSGTPRDEALRHARLAFGGLDRAKEECREALGISFLERVAQDLRFGVRMLRKNPGFTAVAIVALMLGIGLNTAVFTAYKAIFARPLQAHNPGEMVNIALVRNSGATAVQFSYPDYEAIRDSARSFSGVVAFENERTRFSTNAGLAVRQSSSLPGQQGSQTLWLMAPPGTDSADYASVFVVSKNYFAVLSAPPMRGRGFNAISARDLLASPCVLLSENYWKKQFAGDPEILGRTIYLNGVPFTIIGITPRDFVGTGATVPDFWLPASLAPLIHSSGAWITDRENLKFRLFARLAPGSTLAQAQKELTMIFEHLRVLHDPKSVSANPSTVLVWPGSPFPLPLQLYSGLSLTVLLIKIASAMVLVVACADVGSLQMARARSRHDELRTRLALGASRLRIMVQLLTENALLGMIAGGLAFLVSWGLLQQCARIIANATPPDYGTLVFRVTPDLQIFFYVLGISLAAGILFGIAPALEGSQAALASAERNATTSPRNRRIQELLVGLQVAFSLTLMIAGTQLIRSSLNSLHLEPGYETRRTVDIDFQFPDAPEYTPERKLAIVRQIRSHLEAMPGAVELTSARPPGDDGLRTSAVPDGAANFAPATQSIHYTFVQANYFQTLGIPLVFGHAFATQGETADRSIVVSQSAARRLWPGQNPLGRTLRLGPTDEKIHDPRELAPTGALYEVIGVARDIRGLDLNGSDARELYLPLDEAALADRPLLLRAAGDPFQVARQSAAMVSSVDSNLVTTTTSLDDLLRYSPSFLSCTIAAAIASIAGLLGLFPALMGIYGTVSYVVVLRTREIGIRMAIGAQRGDVLRMILRESTRPVLAGLIGGVFLAAAAAYVLRGLLYGIHVVDALSFSGVSLAFFAIALLAAFLPARRAIRIDPMVALRHE